MRFKLFAMMCLCGVSTQTLAEDMPPKQLDGSPGGDGGSGGRVTDMERVVATAPKLSNIPLQSARVVVSTGSPGARFGKITDRREFRGAESTHKDKDSSETCGYERGNPINIATGNKQETEVDFAAQGEWALYLKRRYSSLGTDRQGTTLFGTAWVSNFDYALSFEWRNEFHCAPYSGQAECTPNTNISGIWVHRPDGRSVLFTKLSEGRFVDNKALPVASLVRQGDGSWIHYTEHRTVEHYSRGGFPLSIPNESGITWTFQYGGENGTQLQRVVHTSGRAVEFVWGGRQLREVRDPAGNAYRYTYQGVSGYSLLKSVSPPGSTPTVINYHYAGDTGESGGPSWGLTGKSINGVRYSWFGYTGGLATSTEHAYGADRYQFVYSYGTDGTRTVLETNPLGKQATYVFKDNKPLSVTGHPSNHCQGAYKNTIYDAYGNEREVTDFAGGKTQFEYDAHGHLLKQVDAAGTALARTTTRSWDESGNRVTSMVIEGQGAVAYSYTQGNRLQSVTVTDQFTGQARTTQYTYTVHPNGLLSTATIDGPLPGDTVTYTYSAQGDLLQVKNSLGHTVQYSHHNGLGQPGRTIDENGVITDYGYDARGRTVLVRTYPNGSPVDTRYLYGASGLLEGVEYADGRVALYHYDNARRLVQEDVTAPSGGYEVRRTTYNAMSQPIRVEVGQDN